MTNTVKINYELCDDCGTCVSVCAHDALAFAANEKLCVSDKCVTCGMCVTVCPFAALGVEAQNHDE